jgi:hypothetical protein
MLYITIVLFLLSLLVAWTGRERKLGFWGYFFASLLLSPLIGALLVLVSGPREMIAPPHNPERLQ